jgi:hypothetical protein
MLYPHCDTLPAAVGSLLAAAAVSAATYALASTSGCILY